jgi:hypothetical protein
MVWPRNLCLVVADRHGLRAAKKVKSVVGVGGGDLPKPAAALYLHLHGWREKEEEVELGGAR